MQFYCQIEAITAVQAEIQPPFDTFPFQKKRQESKGRNERKSIYGACISKVVKIGESVSGEKQMSAPNNKPGDKIRRAQLLWTLSLLLTVSTMSAIIGFSAQSATESDRLSKGIAQELLALLPVLGDMMTAEELDHFLRKFAHFFLYLILGCGLTGVANGQKRISPVLLSILVGTVFAATDEFHQFFSDGRGPMLQDVFLDACGVAAGSFLTMLCKRIFKKLCGSDGCDA